MEQGELRYSWRDTRTARSYTFQTEGFAPPRGRTRLPATTRCHSSIPDYAPLHPGYRWLRATGNYGSLSPILLQAARRFLDAG